MPAKAIPGPASTAHPPGVPVGAPGACSNAPLAAASLVELFPLPLISHRWPDGSGVNQRLRDLILVKAGSERSLRASNAGGWHSRRDLQTWPDPSVETLIERIRLLTRELVLRTMQGPGDGHLSDWTIDVWANVNPPGTSNVSHNHTRGLVLWSGIYYVDTGDEGTGGETVFEDRSGVAVDRACPRGPFERELWVRPENGLMLLFPGSLYHRVETYRGARPRISIAFNLKNPAFVLPKYRPRLTPREFMWEYFKGVMIPMTYAQRQLRRVRPG